MTRHLPLTLPSTHHTYFSISSQFTSFSAYFYRKVYRKTSIEPLVSLTFSHLSFSQFHHFYTKKWLQHYSPNASTILHLDFLPFTYRKHLTNPLIPTLHPTFHPHIYPIDDTPLSGAYFTLFQSIKFPHTIYL